ncbi:hypothetical protein Fmac_017841 [Flemingia macrophylla]|uniref:Uncharacterized protein n=1 Tax=Flemingia macrophylla TaxID=520843 RepID=A0ABD1M560_9FABA
MISTSTIVPRRPPHDSIQVITSFTLASRIAIGRVPVDTCPNSYFDIENLGRLDSNLIQIFLT